MYPGSLGRGRETAKECSALPTQWLGGKEAMERASRKRDRRDVVSAR